MSTSRVENYFLVPLEQHYEKQPKVGVRLTISQELSSFSEDVLTKAVAWLKTNRKAMTFPSPAECVQAADVASRSGNAVKVADGITGKNYGAKVAEYAKASGARDFPVITKWADADKTTFTDQWAAWDAYWRQIGAKLPLDLTADRESWTVPTADPSEFDMNAGLVYREAAE